MWKKIVTICTVLFSTTASAGYFTDQAHYYGLGVGLQQIAFEPNYGDDFFPTSVVDFDFFLGSQDEEKFGYELGLDFSLNTSCDTTLYPGQTYPGTTVPLQPGTYQVWQPAFNTQLVYFGINKFLTVNKAKNVKVFGFVGIAAASVEALINFVDDELPGPPDQATINSLRRTFNGFAMIPILKAGVEYKYSSLIGCRVVYVWKNYAAFETLSSDENPFNGAQLKLANTSSIYLELVLTL